MSMPTWIEETPEGALRREYRNGNTERLVALCERERFRVARERQSGWEEREVTEAPFVGYHNGRDVVARLGLGPLDADERAWLLAVCRHAQGYFYGMKV